MQLTNQQFEHTIKKSKKSSRFTKKNTMEKLDVMNQDQKRPMFLTVLCVLSLLSMSVTFLGSINQIMNGPQTEEQLLNQKVELTKTASQLDQMGSSYFGDSVRKMIVMTENINDSFLMVNVVTIISLVFGFFGVFKMFKGFKIGFHFYIFYSLISIGMIYLFVDVAYVPSMVLYWNLFISGLFVLLYSRNLSWMN